MTGHDDLSVLAESDQPQSGTKRLDRPIVASGAANSSIHDVSASTKADPVRAHQLRDDQWDLIRLDYSKLGSGRWSLSRHIILRIHLGDTQV
jgi:hypothetical protein